MDALRLARDDPQRQVVFFAVGFETTAPANAMAVLQAYRQGVHNFSALISHVLVPPAIQVVLDDPAAACRGSSPLDTCARSWAWRPTPTWQPATTCRSWLPASSRWICCRVWRCWWTPGGRARRGCATQYTRSVRGEGNAAAQHAMQESIRGHRHGMARDRGHPPSGLRLREAYAAHDAERRFAVDSLQAQEAAACIAGQVLQGKRKRTSARPSAQGHTRDTGSEHHGLGRGGVLGVLRVSRPRPAAGDSACCLVPGSVDDYDAVDHAHGGGGASCSG